jgi:hypothetical protein
MSHIIHQQKYLPWHIVEKKIQEEIVWLNNSIETFSIQEKNSSTNCRKCLIREIAILIVRGKIKATEIKKIAPLKNFWTETKIKKNRQKLPKMRHGKDWHRETMEQIEHHFISRNYIIDREPNLYWGRADLGVSKKNKQNLYIEVGTISLFKLLINLKMMENSIYLIVPSDDKLIEFICNP